MILARTGKIWPDLNPDRINQAQRGTEGVLRISNPGSKEIL